MICYKISKMDMAKHKSTMPNLMFGSRDFKKKNVQEEKVFRKFNQLF
uniref:Uncharacterized protein n=1 Tax=Rhizophora mucronata TaxID=61149 RepID=A0A2P2NQU9_RHIMU